MKSIIFYSIILALYSAKIATAASAVTVTGVTGNAEVRKGLEENWTLLRVGMILKEIDTILTGEGAEVTLELEDGRTFRLGENAVLDVGDLRMIMEKELFLFLMSRKIDKLTPVNKKTRLEIGNVSVVHGKKAESDSADQNSDAFTWILREENGAKALYYNELYPNAIIKMHKMISRYDSIPDCGSLYYYMGKSFDSMNKPGQAIDHYQQAIKTCTGSDSGSSSEVFWRSDAEEALKRLKRSE